MADDLVNVMVPVLGRSLDPQFNVFDVMHHGLHEKQISNVFAWLLDREGTHGLGDRFVRIFVEAVNHTSEAEQDLALDDTYWVRQEVNTLNHGVVADIADLVLESDRSVLVVENYFTSDGHGHDYGCYLAFGQRGGKRARVVLLCSKVEDHLLTNGWEDSAVVPYGGVIGRLFGELSADRAYQRKNPEAFAFIEQIYRKFTEGAGPVDESNALAFVVAMCETGEARRYQTASVEAATEQFAADLAAQGRERFGEGRNLLHEIKRALRGYCIDVTKGQLNSALGEGYVSAVSARYSGIYQWTINFDVPTLAGSDGEAPLQLKFGPSAWFAITHDESWRVTPQPSRIDYGTVFVCRSGIGEIRPTSVTLEQVLAGLDADDTRLCDELVALLGA